MSVTIQWLGHASFRIEGDECVVYIDPWKLTDEPHDADIVFISHSHHDHCSPDDIAKVCRNETTVIGPGEVIQTLQAGQSLGPGDEINLGCLSVEAIAAYNIDKSFHPKGNGWLGVVLDFDGQRVYYAGDTDRTPEMIDLMDIDVALLPVGGTYTLSAAEAADACKAIGCKMAVPYHWGDIVGHLSDAKTFKSKAACPVTILLPGESMTL